MGATLREGLDRVETMLAKMAGVTADLIAKKFTVTLGKDSRSPVGHGLLISLNGSRYLLSAAHVIVDLAGAESVCVGFTGTTPVSVQCSTAFIPLNYVLSGAQDLGLLLIGAPQENEKKAEETEEKETQTFLEAADAIGRELLGHGLVHLRGNALACNELGRVLLHTPSVPGCSGAPLFAPEGQLVALVHGNSKHRLGRHAFSHEDDAVSPYLYADGVLGVALLAVPEDHVALLKLAEDVNIDEEWAQKPTSVPDDLPDLWNSMNAYLKLDTTELKRTSLTSLMKAAASFIWPASNPVDLQLRDFRLLDAASIK
jgi:hypothetical protein